MNDKNTDTQTAFNERASLVIYAENPAAMAVAAEIAKQLDNRQVDVEVRRGQAPFRPGSYSK